MGWLPVTKRDEVAIIRAAVGIADQINFDLSLLLKRFGRNIYREVVLIEVALECLFNLLILGFRIILGIDLLENGERSTILVNAINLNFAVLQGHFSPSIKLELRYWHFELLHEFGENSLDPRVDDQVSH